MRGYQIRLFHLPSQTELVELELPWLMKEAAGLKVRRSGAAPIAQDLSHCGVGDYAESQEPRVRGLRNSDKELRKA